MKQYEVAINPERLKGMQIDIAQVFHALEKNNSIAGGGYIERTNESFSSEEKDWCRIWKTFET